MKKNTIQIIRKINRDFASGQMEIRLTDAGKGEYRKKGADTWIPFSSVTDLGTGRSFDVKQIAADYHSLTLSNFVVEISSFQAGTSSPTGSGSNLWPNGNFILIKSYDADTGVLTAYGDLSAGYSSSTPGVSGYSHATQNAHAYLIR